MNNDRNHIKLDVKWTIFNVNVMKAQLQKMFRYCSRAVKII